jgi:hypothetical protein
MNKNDMMALIRSVAVPTDVEEGMSHAYDLGVEWGLMEAIRIITLEVDDPQASNAIKRIRKLNENTTT